MDLGTNDILMTDPFLALDNDLDDVSGKCFFLAVIIPLLFSGTNGVRVGEGERFFFVFFHV